ncbi:MAG: hypothetical protein Q9186_006630 [Xanthomendoza sp. 1 TL-2023]
MNETQFRQTVDKWLQGPALEAPDGLASNFVNGPSLQSYNVACQSICLTLVTFFIFVRIYTKARILKSLGWDDLVPELISAVLNVVSDFAILTLLIYMVWKLQMRREKKIAISAIFATGLL